MLKKKLKGLGVALITPFTKDNQIDFNALEKIIEHNKRNNVDYFVVLGTTAESPVLSTEEKREIILFVSEKAGKKMPLVVGVGNNYTTNVVKELEALPLDKATAIMSVTPYYNKPSQEGIFQHYKKIAQYSPKPIIVYNVPGRTGINMLPTTVKRLANELPQIQGIKEASSDVVHCQKLLLNVPKDFFVATGDDALVLPLMACGMDGVISVIGNAFPKQMSELTKLCLNKKFDKAQKLLSFLLEADEYCFIENNPAGVKAFLSQIGFCENILRLPLVPLSKQYYDAINAIIKKYGY